MYPGRCHPPCCRLLTQDLSFACGMQAPTTTMDTQRPLSPPCRLSDLYKGPCSSWCSISLLLLFILFATQHSFFFVLMVFRLPTHVTPFVPPPSSQTMPQPSWRGSLFIDGFRPADRNHQGINVIAAEVEGNRSVCSSLRWNRYSHQTQSIE